MAGWGFRCRARKGVSGEGAAGAVAQRRDARVRENRGEGVGVSRTQQFRLQRLAGAR